LRVIHVLRKPLATATVAQSLVRHKTGALHIEACRVGSDTTRGDRYGGKAPQGGGTGHAYVSPHSDPWDVPAGRWPTNLILEHLPECELVGTKRVRVIGAASHQFHHDSRSVVTPFGIPNSHDGYRGEGGLEEVEDWRCVEGCPVRDLEIPIHPSKFYLQVGGRRCPDSDE